MKSVLKNNSKQFLNFSYLMTIFYLVMSVLIFAYIYKLEKNKCKCSHHWSRSFIKYYTILMIVILIPYFINQGVFLKVLIKNDLAMILLSIIKLLGIVYFVVLVNYFYNLKITECECSKNWKRKTLLYPVVTLSIGMILLIFISLKQTLQYLVK